MRAARCRAGLGAVLAGLVLAVPAWSQEAVWPAYSDAALLPAEREADFPELAAALTGLNESSRQAYSVVLLASTGGREARDTLDGMVEAWRGAGAGGDDPRRVIVLMAEKERMIAVRGGAELQASYGFQGERIDREMVSRYFIPYAKAGDLEQGLVALVEGIETWITSQDAPVVGETAPASPGPVEAAPPKPTPPQPATVEAVSHAPSSSRWWIPGGVALLGLGGLAGWKMRRTRKKRQAMLEPARLFTADVVALLDEVETLSRRHSLLTFSDPDYEAPMVGETLALYDGTHTQLEQLRDHWLTMMTATNQLKMYLDSPAGLSQKDLAEMEPLIREHDQREEARTLVTDCRGRLDALETAHEATDAALTELGTRMAEVDARLEQVVSDELSTLPYEADGDRCRALRDEAAGLRTADPVGARAPAGEADALVQHLAGWLDRILAGREQLALRRNSLDEVRRQAGEKRGQGLLLMEEDGNPDPMLAQARQECDAAELALNRGEDESAVGHLEQATTWDERAREAMHQQEQARIYCRGAVPACTSRLAEVREHWRAAADPLDQLAKLYAEASWQDVAGHRDQAGRILEALTPLLATATEAADEGKQWYFHAEDLLVHVEQQVEQAASLLDDIGERLDELGQSEAQSRDLIKAVGGELEGWGQAVKDGGAILDEAWPERLAKAQALFAAVQERMQAEQPHWPVIESHLDALQELIDEGMVEIGQERAEHAAFQEVLARVTEASVSLQRWLEEREEDRREANRMAAAAIQRLDRLSGDAASLRGAWGQARMQAQDVGEDLDAARRLAEKDVQLAKESRRVIGQAEGRVQRARSFYEQGVSAESSSAQRWLVEAEGALKRKRYEDALEKAAEAINAADAALELASKRARERRRKRNLQRMEQLGTTLIHAAAAYHGARRGSRVGHSRPHRRVSSRSVPQRPTFPSRTWKQPPPPSWGGSGTSQSRW